MPVNERLSKAFGFSISSDTMTLFQPESWLDDCIELTVELIECSLNEQNVEDYMETMLSKPYIFEVFISAASVKTVSYLSQKVIEAFPTDSNTFANSLSSKILSRLSLSLLFLEYPSEIDTPTNLQDCHRSVELAIPALDAISSLRFTEQLEEEEDGSEAIKVRRKLKSQRHKKNSNPGRKTVVDPVPFRNLVVDIPSSLQEAKNLVTEILNDQKGVLRYYFEILRRPSLVELLRKRASTADVPAQSSSPADKTVAEPSLAESKAPDESEASAYPKVQPMKAALYFESAQGLGDWHIFISTRADGDLREAHRKDSKTFKIIIKKITELSNGHFSDDNQKRLNGPNLDIPIYEAKMSRDLRLVYQVDCIPEFDSEVERQVIKVFGVYTHAQMDNRLWGHIGNQVASRGKEYKRRCTFRNQPYHTGDNVIGPASFPPQTEADRDLASKPNIPSEYLQEIHSLLVLEKFVTLSQALLNSILADKDVAHVFAVSSKERQIIEHTSSCYVIGRSGTGKTTTMLFKMLGIQRSWEHGSPSVPKPRQLFVTRSRVLASKVEEYFAKLTNSLVLGSQKPGDILGAAQEKRAEQDKGLVNYDDDSDWRSDLPRRFSELEESHFPLFITFDHLCRMLEEDLGCSMGSSSEGVDFADVDVLSEVSEANLPVHDRHRTSRSLVSYDVFLESYWPHMPQALTKGLDPSLIFSEIMGVLKGSELALTCAAHCLDKHAYVGLSHRSQSTFATQRDIIYSLFQSYQKRKRERDEYDAVDRTHALLSSIHDTGSSIGRKIDFLYVDEVQDNHLVDACLLRSICRNPNGLFWAGDTAQTISVGSSFKFAELKAFLHRTEQKQYKQSGPSTKPLTFQLAVNYRSHGGIVRCAHSVVNLITRFWPNAIDSLDEEKGIVDGLKPVFFGGRDEETVRYEQFLFGDTKARIEFGARQCILVRNDTVRDALRKEVGEIGLIMTLYESKGLEFDDVLLYNFFEDSTARLSQWRVVFNAFEEGDRIDISAPRFNEARHASVCSELKFLYVAITRARNNLWIFDRSEKAEPMRVLWSSRNLVDIYTSDMDLPQLQAASTPEEWSRTGKSLFDHDNYLQAMHCFKRAGLSWETSVANAFYLREQARRSNSPARIEAFVSAAEAFVEVAQCADTDSAKRAYFKNAGNCYMRAEDDRNAAQSFVDACEFTTAAQLYRKAGLFGEAVKVVQERSVQQDVADKVIHAARLFHFQKTNLEEASKLFESLEERLEFVDEYGFDDAQAAILESAGQFLQAAELHLSEGRIFEAIRLFLVDSGNEHAARRAKECLVDCLWQNFSFGRSGDSADASRINTDRLLNWAMNPVIVKRTNRDEIYMFKTIVSGDSTELQQLGQKFNSNAINDRASALLCFHHAFMESPQISTATILEVASTLQNFLAYAQLLREAALLSDPCEKASIRRLFGFQLSSPELVFLPRGTFLHEFSLKESTPVSSIDDTGSTLSRWEFLRLYKRSLAKYLRLVVEKEDNVCRDARALSPCLPFSAFGYCNRDNCMKDHVDPAAKKAELYNLRVRVHLQQIQILQTLHFIRLVSEQRLEQHMYWLTQLYETLNPAHYSLGTLSDLDPMRIPETSIGLQILREWLRNMFYGSHFLVTQASFLTNLSTAASISFTFDRRAASDYTFRTPCLLSPRPQSWLASNENSVECLLRFLASNDSNCLSAGIFFLRQILETSPPMDLNLVCNIAEYLCGSLVLCRAYYRSLSIHGITLPRSWILNLTGVLDSIPSRDMCHLRLWEFVTVMGNLLEEVSLGTKRGRLIFEGRSLSQCGGQVRNAFVARICRCMCLFGYNVGGVRMRQAIFEHIIKLRGHPFFHFSCKRYIFADDWPDLVRALRQSTSSDETILLHDLNTKRPLPAKTFGMRLLEFKIMQEIPHLIVAGSGFTKAPTLRKDAEPFKRMEYHITMPAISIQHTEDVEHVVEKDDGHMEENLEEMQEDVEPDDVEETLDADIGALPRTLPIPPPEEHVQAALVIQLAYRRAERGRRVRSKSGLPASRTRLWKCCWEVSQTMEWPDTHYRFFFLGPLVHVLVCLEGIYSYASSNKDKAKKSLKNTQHLELEEAGERLTKLSNLLKDVTPLRKLLQPKSDFHRRRNVEELKAHVLNVEGIMQKMRQLPSNNAHELQDDLELGLKGIVKQRQCSTKKEKPQLSIDDFDDI